MKHLFRMSVMAFALTAMCAYSQDANAQRVRKGGKADTKTTTTTTQQAAPAAPATTAAPAAPAAAAAPAANDDARRQGIRDALAALTAQDKIENVVMDTKTSPKYLVLPNGKAMMLQITKNDINQERSSVMPIDETNIYPGCIVYANGELMAGKPQEVDFGVKDQLGTVTVFVNFNNGGKESRTGVKAEASSIRAAIASILESAGGNTPPASVQSVHNQYTSVSKMAIDMGCSLEYLDAKCDINTSTSVGSETMYDMQSFSQNFYTVTIEPENKDKTYFFGPGVTADVLKRAAKDCPIAIIKSVTYGRSGFYKKEYKASDFSFKGDESASYKGQTFSSKQDISKNSTATTQTGRVYGGSATTAGKALTEGDFTKEMAQNMEVSASNQGVPVSYTVQFIASGKQCTQKQTGSYEDVNYVPLSNSVSLSVNNDAKTLGGTKSVKIVWSYDIIKINKSGDEAVADGSGSGEHEWSNKSSMTKLIELGPNRYFKDNQINFHTESRKAASAGLNKWKPNHSGKLTIPSSGSLKLKLTGNYYKYDVPICDEKGNQLM